MVNNNIKEYKSKRKVELIETNVEIQKKVDFFENTSHNYDIVQEEVLRKQKLFEQNKKIMRERMRKLKEFMKEKRQNNQSNEEFFEENKQFFEQYNVKDYNELLNLLYNYDRENPDEAEKELREKYIQNLKIEHIKDNDLNLIPELKNNNNSNITQNSGVNSFKILENCSKTNEYNYNVNKKEYINNKVKDYEIKKFEYQLTPGIKKTKYNNESELVESSNIINISYEKIGENSAFLSENNSHNGIPIDELKNKNIKKLVKHFLENDKNNYEKVESLIKDINNTKLKNSSILNNSFCINCNECFKPEDVQNHKDHCILRIHDIYNNNNYIDDELNINDIDYNANLKQLYENLKNEQKKILISGNEKLINYYGKLLYSLYEIIINNNSIEDLNTSIININDDYIKDIEPENFFQYFKDYFLFCVHRIIKLTYFKEKKIEKLLADLYEENMDKELDKTGLEENYSLKSVEKIIIYGKNSNNNIEEIISPKMSGNLDNISFEEFTEEDKKKYFLKLGIGLKFEYGKNDCITELYSKAKEQDIDPNNYENFIKKELNILKN